jgi:chromosome segregation ATPase
MERIDGVESSIATLSNARRSDLAEIFGKLSVIDNKLSMLDTRKDVPNSKGTSTEVDVSEIRKTVDYIIKGIAAEKLENVRTRELFVNLVNSLASNKSNSADMFQNIIDNLESQAEKLINTELIIKELKRENERVTTKVDNLETKMETLVSTELLNTELRKDKDLMASKIGNLETELKMRKKAEERLMSKLESISSDLDTVKVGLEAVKNEDRTVFEVKFL